MGDEHVPVDMSASPSMRLGEQKNSLNMEVNGLQVSTSPSSAQLDSLHAEATPAEVSLQGSTEAAPMELAPPAEHLPDSAGEQAQQHSSHQAQLYILHSQRLPSSRPQHRLQPAAIHSTLR